jgi:ribonuclease D
MLLLPACRDQKIRRQRDHCLSVQTTGRNGVEVAAPKVLVAEGDLSPDFLASATLSSTFAIDIETTGLDYLKSDIGSIQVYNGDDTVCIIRPPYSSPRLLGRILADESIRKIFHHALFDLRFLKHRLGLEARNISCTKIAAKIVSPDQEKHSLASLVKTRLNVELNKSYQTSNWMRESFSSDQLQYAVNDVIYLPKLLDVLLQEAVRKGVSDLVTRSFEYIPVRVDLDLSKVGDVFVY